MQELMFEAAATEFPFVVTLPKREKSKLMKLWEALDEFKAVQAQYGGILPASFAAKLLGVSKQRVSELMSLGTLARVELDGHVFVTERSLVEFAKSERKAGRPWKKPGGKEMWGMAMEVAKEGLAFGGDLGERKIGEK